MKSLLKSALLATLLAAVTGAWAAPTLKVEGGILKGAQGVDIGGTLYNVSFADSTCVAVFSGCNEPSDFLFQTQAQAAAAAQALLDQVLVDGASGNFDSRPELTFGCSESTYCWVLSFYWDTGFGLGVNMNAYNAADPGADRVLGPYFDPDAGSRGDLTYAVWTLADTQSVPEPSSLLLAGAALAGLAWRRRRAR